SRRRSVRRSGRSFRTTSTTVSSRRWARCSARSASHSPSSARSRSICEAAVATDRSGFLLLAAVGAVGVLHTVVPDHWGRIVVLARRRHWSARETAGAALQAGAGHVASTLAIAALAWIAGVAASQRFGRAVDTTASMALVGLGAWIALSAWNDLRSAANAHPHDPIHPRRHEHEAPDHNAKSRPALLLILGSSPMFEGSPPSLLRPDMARRCWSR